MQEFIKPLAGSAVSPEETGVLSYGTEYLICGKDSDVSNLKGTVNRLLLLREAVNYLYLQTDQAKQSESLAIAGAIGGALANPAVVAAIHQGILAAWAYVESISDVKGLLAGGKIPLIKSPDSWHTRLSAFSESLAGEYAGEARGFTYENYLDVLLYGKSLKQIAYRSMDLMEKNMQQEKRAEWIIWQRESVLLQSMTQSRCFWAYSAKTAVFGIILRNSRNIYMSIDAVCGYKGESLCQT